MQDDCASAYDDPAFHRMRATYGGLAAQIVTPVLVGGRVAGIVSVHDLRSARHWTAAEVEACRASSDAHRRPPLMHNRWHPELEPVAEVEPGDDASARDGGRARGPSDPGERPCRRGTDGPRCRAPARGPGLRPRGRAGRPARGRARLVRDSRLRRHGRDPGLRLPRRPVPGPVRRQVGDRRRRRALGRAAGSRRSGRSVRGRHRRRARRARSSSGSREREEALRAPRPARRGRRAGGGRAGVGRGGLRTIPPRETGGNLDIRQLVAGSRLCAAGRRAGCALLGRRPALRAGRR